MADIQDPSNIQTQVVLGGNRAWNATPGGFPEKGLKNFTIDKVGFIPGGSGRPAKFTLNLKFAGNASIQYAYVNLPTDAANPKTKAYEGSFKQFLGSIGISGHAADDFAGGATVAQYAEAIMSNNTGAFWYEPPRMGHKEDRTNITFLSAREAAKVEAGTLTIADRNMGGGVASSGMVAAKPAPMPMGGGVSLGGAPTAPQPPGMGAAFAGNTSLLGGGGVN